LNISNSAKILAQNRFRYWLLVFLAGEGAGYITGQVFGVNGGLVI
jgi:hypothetical protein